MSAISATRACTRQARVIARTAAFAIPAARAISTSTPRYESSATIAESSSRAAARIESIEGPHNLAQPPLALQAPPTHPPTHGIHVASLHLSAHHPSVLTQFADFALHAAYSLGMPCSKPASLPIRRSLYTVIKSPFVHKKAQENFERKTHKRLIKVWDTDAEVLDKWLRYLRKYAVGGVGIKVQVFEFAEFGVGSKDLEEALKPFDAAPQQAKLQKTVDQLTKDLKEDAKAAKAASSAS